jgi:hypothetical protein
MVLEKYNPIWINHSEAIKRAIEQVLGENQYEIAHIGDRGTTIDIEFLTGVGTCHGFGVAKDNKRNVYKVIF